MATNRRQFSRDLRGIEVAGARHALERNIIDVAARYLCDGSNARLRRRRRQQKNRRDRSRAEQRRELHRLLRWIVDDEHAIDAGLARAIGKCRRPHRLDRIRVAHQHDGCGRVALPKSRDRVEHVIEADVLRQRTLRGALNHGPVGHRVGKRHTELDDIGTRRDQGVHDRQRHGKRRIAHRDVRNEPRAAGGAELDEGGVDPVHAAEPADRSATVFMSLSPRPERFTSRILSRSIVAASLVA